MSYCSEVFTSYNRNPTPWRSSSGDTFEQHAGAFAFGGVAMTAGDGKPCKKCGTSEWYKSGHCKYCKRIYDRRWVRDNRDKERARCRKWYRENKEKHWEITRKWREKNPKRHAENNLRWERKNRGKRAAAERRRYARKNENGGDHTASEFRRLCEYYDNRCLKCGQTGKLTADHIVPVVRGGSNDISNIQPLCMRCNQSKGTKIRDYRKKPGMRRWIQKRLF